MKRDDILRLIKAYEATVIKLRDHAVWSPGAYPATDKGIRKMAAERVAFKWSKRLEKAK